MVKKLLIPVIIIICAVVVWLLFFNESPEQKVLKRLKGLAECASKRAGEKTSGMVLKSQMVSGYFDDSCSLMVDEHHLAGDYTPEEISARMVQIRTFFTEMSLDFYEPKVTFPGPDRAEVTFTGHLTGTLKQGDRINEVRELKADLKLKDGKWRFYNFKVTQVITK